MALKFIRYTTKVCFTQNVNVNIFQIRNISLGVTFHRFMIHGTRISSAHHHAIAILTADDAKMKHMFCEL